MLSVSTGEGWLPAQAWSKAPLYYLFIYFSFILLMNHFAITPGPENWPDCSGDQVSVFHVTVGSEMAWGGGPAGTGRVAERGLSDGSWARGGAVRLGTCPLSLSPQP